MLLHGRDSQATQAAHDALKSSDMWVNLHLDRYQPGIGELFEMRRCPQCGSTILKECSKSDAINGLTDTNGIVRRSLSILDLNDRELYSINGGTGL